MREKTLFGKMLNRLRSERELARRQAEADLWKRNKLSNPTQRDGYRLAESVVVQQDGREVQELRLYKLIDASIITINGTVESTIETGINKLRENNR